jgi:hypothetical protein
MNGTLALGLVWTAFAAAPDPAPGSTDWELYQSIGRDAAPPFDDPAIRSWDGHRRLPTMLTFGREDPPRWVSGPRGAARAFVQRHGGRLGLDEADLRHLEVDEVHDLGGGLIVVRLHGRVDGIDVFRDQLNVALDQQLRLLGITGSMSPDLADGAVAAHRLTPETALGVALAHVRGDTPDLRCEAPRDAWSWCGGPDLGDPTRVRPVLFPHPQGLVPASHVELTIDAPEPAMWSLVIDDRTAEVLFRKNLVAEHPHTYRVYADTQLRPQDGPNGNDEIPDESATVATPPRTFVLPSLRTLDHAGISTGDPWLPLGATETVGNNADAYVDLNSPSGLSTGDFRAPTSGAATFDYVYDDNLDASATDDQRRASIVHAFYVVNYLHDLFYDVGFDEVAGNAQANNYGRGGAGGDSMRVEVQDYSGRNNANMSTPSDGGRPRMQMYLWDEIDRTALRVLSPPPVATDFETDDASFGPRDFDVTAEIVVATAGGAADVCTPPLDQIITGKIALVEEGPCGDDVQTKNLQDAGAVAALIAPTSGGPDRLTGSIATTIGALSIGWEAADVLRAEVSTGPVQARIQRDEGEELGSSLDTLVVAHEWGHYISNRLIGNSNGLVNKLGRGMGEGWSDFHGLLVTVQPEDRGVFGNDGYDGVYAASNTVARRGPYFGIRRVPYSTNPSYNALAYRHIQDGEPLPVGPPTAFGQSGASNSQVHRTGEVWATMLWESYAALLNDPDYTFTDARDRMMSYLVGGFKLTPVAPTMVEARDAILLAAFARDPADFTTLYEAFARRGLGVGAGSPDRFASDHRPATESYAIGAHLALQTRSPSDGLVWCDREGRLDAGETGQLVVTVTNDGAYPLLQPTAAVRSLTTGLSFPDGGQLSLPALAPFESATATVAVAASGFSQVTVGTVQLEVSDNSLALGPSQVFTESFRLHFDEVPGTSADDDVEGETIVWQLEKDVSGAAGFARVAASPVDHRWAAPNDDFPSDVRLVSPRLDVGAAPLVLTFDHRYDIEPTWDGGVIEVSTDDGATWTDVDQYVAPGYDVVLRDTQYSALRARPAYSGRSTGYPAFTTRSLDFGTAFAGQSLRFRFRLASDFSLAFAGWEIDNIRFAGLLNTPFSSIVPDRGLCVNRPPLAMPGPDLLVDEGQTVNLLDQSTDPDGDALVRTWSQVDGPAVSDLIASFGTFTAPPVDEDTLLTFQLSVWDGEFSDGPVTHRVLVRPLNGAPSVTIEGPSTAPEGATVALEASGTDPDGDPLRFEWRQLEGPAVQAAEVDGPDYRFTTPDINADTELVFEVTATDGAAISLPQRWVLTVHRVNRAPAMVVTEDLDVREGEPVSIHAWAFDADGDVLQYGFQPEFDLGLDAVEGPSDVFRFRAPEVRVDTVFEVVVFASDGVERSPFRTVSVTVRDVPPPAEPEPPVSDPPTAATLDDAGGCASTPLDGPMMWLVMALGVPLFRRRPRRQP